jgi:hypothetical protein
MQVILLASAAIFMAITFQAVFVDRRNGYDAANGKLFQSQSPLLFMKPRILGETASNTFFTLVQSQILRCFQQDYFKPPRRLPRGLMIGKRAAGSFQSIFWMI